MVVCSRFPVSSACPITTPNVLCYSHWVTCLSHTREEL